MPSIGNIAGAETQRRTSRAVTAATSGWINAVLQVIREGTPSQVKVNLDDLIAEGHLEQEDISQMQDIDEEELLEYPDAEVSWEDEDTPEPDFPNNRDLQDPERHEAEVIMGEEQDFGQKGDEDAFCSQDLFDIAVIEGKCRFCVPGWMGSHIIKTKTGGMAIREIDRRFFILGRIAEWLSSERTAFLKDPKEWLHLGPKDYNEVCEGNISIFEDSLRKMLELNGVDKSTFSRCLKSTRLVWPHGSMDLKMIFSKEAQAAWTARSIRLFMEKNGYNEEDRRKAIEDNKGLKTPRNAEDQKKYLNQSIDSMDIEPTHKLKNNKSILKNPTKSMS